MRARTPELPRPHGKGDGESRGKRPSSRSTRQREADHEDHRALRLENEALRHRIRELERANEELAAFANPQSGLTPNAGTVLHLPDDQPAGGDAGSPGTLRCPRCARDVPSSNYEAHLVHCERNFYRCQACGDVLPLRDKDEHLASWREAARALQAAKENNCPFLRQMRAHGADFEAIFCPQTHESLLIIAAQQGCPEMLSLLLSRGTPTPAWLAAISGSGQAALHVAVTAGHETTTALLLASRAEVNQLNSAKETPLLVACRSGHASLIRPLVEARADLDARTTLGDSPLQVAQSHGHMECCLALGVRRVPSSKEEGSYGIGMPPVQPLGARGSLPAAAAGKPKRTGPGSAPATPGTWRPPPSIPMQ